ncbi:hypothetical protein [Bradyrhizobium sp. C9]|uniref:hypothetical protein n=1 Tax=Bradyrhizobium sp. C9 TaxID=142585 RepID=UPI000BE86D86|nr:hypothetical protein [Bradyrhizobium sp. C9]PDT71454.1 hypothetical protein CO675_37130 [Bradyrhizobium sp. C9]
MKRSRRVWLKLMGSVAISAASIGLSPSQASSHHHAGHKARRKPEQISPSGGFGDAPRSIARYDNGLAHGGG